MSYIDELIKKGLEWFNKFRYSLPRLPYADADFTRNLWIISMKKAIREFIRKYAKHVNKYDRTIIAQVLNKAIMKLYSFPELKDRFEKIITELLTPKFKSDISVKSSVILEIPKPLEAESQVAVDSQLITQLAIELTNTSSIGILSRVEFYISE